MTKKNRAMYEAYMRATDRRLEDAYGRASERKRAAFRSCVRTLEEMQGYDGRIVSHNTFRFSYAFRYMQDGEERIRYITADNNYDFAI